MKKTANIVAGIGLALLVIGFILPWYYWPVELIGEDVKVGIMGGGAQLNGWQMFWPAARVQARPAYSGPYANMGETTAEIQETIGLTWSGVPGLVPLGVIATLTLLGADRIMGHSRLRNGLGLAAIGGLLLAALVLWSPSSPAPLEKLELVGLPGKLVTLLGAVACIACGGLNFFIKRPANAPAADAQAEHRTCVHCHASIPKILDICPKCGRKQ